MQRTYKFKLEPTAEQIELIEQTLDLCRWLYNSMLEQRKLVYQLRNVSLTLYTEKRTTSREKRIS